MAVLTGALRTVKGNTIAQFCKDFTSYLTSSGAPPLANGLEVPQAPQSIRGQPEPLQTIYAIKQLVILLEVTQHLKTLELGKGPFRPLEQNHVQSVSRQRRPELYQTIPTIKTLRKWFYPYKKITLQNTTNWLYKIVFTNKKLPRG